jgi:hypothetical protein
MAHNTITFASIISAALIPLATPGAVAGNAWTPYADERTPGEQTRWAAPPPPYFFYFLRHIGPDDDAQTTIYLNGWGSSSNPHDCNRGCVNSNGS